MIIPNRSLDHISINSTHFVNVVQTILSSAGIFCVASLRRSSLRLQQGHFKSAPHNIKIVLNSNDRFGIKEILFAALLTALTLTACSSGDDLVQEATDTTETGSSDTSGNSASTITSPQLSGLTVAIDRTALSETESVPSDDEDYVETYSPSHIINIVYNGATATVSGSADGVTIAVNGADVAVTSTTADVNYVLSGSTTDGSFKMEVSSTKKFELTLNGVNINNNDGPAINIQSGKRCYVVLADNSSNYLSDGTSYTKSSEDQKGTLFSEGQLLFSGAGKLRIAANTKAGIASDDYLLFRPKTNIYVKATKGNAIKANDGITIRGGVINVETAGTAAKGISSDGFMTVEGGRTTAIATGGAEYDSDEKDVSGATGVKADSTITVTGGLLNMMSTGKGGKGISTDQNFVVNGGTVTAVTTGATFTYSSSLDSKAKGIKADGNVTINGGNVLVRATGGEGSEGLEAKGTLTINGGTTEVLAYDDAINAALDLTVNDGFVYA